MNEIVFLITGVIAWRLHTSFNHLSAVPKEIPWVGKTGTLVPYIWTQIKAIWKTPSTISEAYHKVTAHTAKFHRYLLLICTMSSTVNMGASAPSPCHSVGLKFCCLAPSSAG